MLKLLTWGILAGAKVQKSETNNDDNLRTPKHKQLLKKLAVVTSFTGEQSYCFEFLSIVCGRFGLHAQLLIKRGKQNKREKGKKKKKKGTVTRAASKPRHPGSKYHGARAHTPSTYVFLFYFYFLIIFIFPSCRRVFQSTHN